MTYSPELIAVPSSITVNVSDGETGVVANVQTPLDGNIYQVEEDNGASPAFDIEFVFSGINFIPNALTARAWYQGSSSHEVTIEVYDYNGAAFIPMVHEQRFSNSFFVMNLELPGNAIWVSAGAARVKWIHGSSGIGTHFIQWDYVSLRYTGRY